MILSDKTIKEYINEEKIKIEPILDEEQIQPSSVDIRLGNTFKTFKKTDKIYIDTKNNTNIEEYMQTYKIKDNKPFIIHPNEFALATTLEHIELPSDIVARVEGRSSIGRLGVTVHVTAGYIDPAFKGKITLEISNIGTLPVALYPKQRVGQIVFETMTTPAEKPYGHKDRNSKYMFQSDVTASRINNDGFL